jgi:hypothetical protein
MLECFISGGPVVSHEKGIADLLRSSEREQCLGLELVHVAWGFASSGRGRPWW